MRGDFSRPFGILGLWGTMGIYIGRSAAQGSRPKGDSRIYSMRILINPNGRYIGGRDCVLLGTSAALREIRSAMVRMMSVSLTRVKCSRPPTDRDVSLV